jgi:hypothetical protein
LYLEDVMPRPKALNPKVAVKVFFEPEVYAELRLRLFNPDYAYGVKHGDMSTLINGVVKDALKRGAGKGPGQ